MAGRRNSKQDLKRLNGIRDATGTINGYLDDLGINEPPIEDEGGKAVAFRGAFKAEMPEDQEPPSGAAIALLVPEEITQALREAVGDETAEADHLTLLYLGQADDLAAHKANILQSLALWCQVEHPVTGVIGGYGRFTNTESDDGDAVWAAFDSPEMPRLRESLGTELEYMQAVLGVVLPPPNHGFTPHITLFYLDPAAEMPTLDLPPLAFTFTEVALLWGGEQTVLRLGHHPSPVAPEDAITVLAQAGVDFAGIQAIWYDTERGVYAIHETFGQQPAEPMYADDGADGEIIMVAPAGDAGYQQREIILQTLGSSTAFVAAGYGDARPELLLIYPSAETRTAPSSVYYLSASPVRVLTESGDAVTIGGYACLFDNPGESDGRDLYGEFFTTKSTTGLDTRDPTGMPFYWDHTLPSRNQANPQGIRHALGTVTRADKDQKGWWLECEIDLHREYAAEVVELVKKGITGYSLGALAHTLLIAADGEIKRFEAGEVSGTVRAAEPRLIGLRIYDDETAPGGEVLGGTTSMSKRTADQVVAAGEHTAPGAATAGSGGAQRSGTLDPSRMTNPIRSAPQPTDGQESPTTRASIDDLIGGGGGGEPTDDSNDGGGESDGNNGDLAGRVEALESDVATIKDDVSKLVDNMGTIVENGVTAVIERMQSESGGKRYGSAPRRGTNGANGGSTRSRSVISDVRGPDLVTDQTAEARKHFERYVRTGRRPDYDWAVKVDAGVDVINMTLDQQGGILVPRTYAEDIFIEIAQGSVLRNAGASVRTQDNFGEYVLRRMNKSGRAKLIKEGQTAEKQAPTFEQKIMRPRVYSYEVPVSNMQLQNPSVDILAEVIQPDMTAAFAEAENEDFLKGTGVNEPQGLLVGGEVGVTTAGSLPTGDEILTLQHKLPEAYRSNGIWILSDDMLLAIRKLKTSNGDWILQSGLQQGVPSTILGHRYLVMDAMPVPAAGAKVMIFADLRYFIITNFVGMTMQRLTEKYAEDNETAFLWYQYLDSVVRFPKAVQIMQIKEG